MDCDLSITTCWSAMAAIVAQNVQHVAFSGRTGLLDPGRLKKPWLQTISNFKPHRINCYSYYNLKNWSSNQWLGYFRKGDFSRLFLKDDVLQLTFENERLDMVLSAMVRQELWLCPWSLQTASAARWLWFFINSAWACRQLHVRAPLHPWCFHKSQSHCMMLTACSFDKLWL